MEEQLKLGAGETLLPEATLWGQGDGPEEVPRSEG